MVIFYTLPPRSIFYPFILINAHRPEQGLNYITDFWRDIYGVIIDSGVEVFRDPNVKDYPYGSRYWIRRLVGLYHHVKSLAPNSFVLVTCPDYPDDYNPRSLWISEEITNIERTVENVKTCISEYPYVNWLIPIQGHYKKPASLLKSIKYYNDLGIFDRFKYFAVANLCVEPDINIIYKSVLVVRRALKEIGVLDNVELHVFGLKIQALKKVKDLIQSFDSTSWTRPVNSIARRIRNASAKSENERKIFFCEYIKALFYKYDVDIDPRVLERCGAI